VNGANAKNQEWFVGVFDVAHNVPVIVEFVF